MLLLYRLLIIEVVLLAVVLGIDDYDSGPAYFFGTGYSSNMTIAEIGQLFQKQLSRRNRVEHKKNNDEFHKHVEKIEYSTSLILTNDSSKIALFSKKFDQSNSKIVVKFRIWSTPGVKLAICLNMDKVIHSCRTVQSNFESGHEKRFKYASSAKVNNEHPTRVMYLFMKSSESPYEFLKIIVKSKLIKTDGSSRLTLPLDATPKHVIKNDVSIDTILPNFHKIFSGTKELKISKGKVRSYEHMIKILSNGLGTYEQEFLRVIPEIKIQESTSIILNDDSQKIALFSNKIDESFSKIVIKFKIWSTPNVKFAICRNMNMIIHNCKTVETEFEPGQEKYFVYSSNAKLYNEHPARVVYLVMKTNESSHGFLKLTLDKVKSKRVKGGSIPVILPLDATPKYMIKKEPDSLLPNFQKFFADKKELEVYDGKARICSTLACDFENRFKGNKITNNAYLSYECTPNEKCIVGLVSGNYSTNSAKNWTLTFKYFLTKSASLKFMICFYKNSLDDTMALTLPCEDIPAEVDNNDDWKMAQILLPKDSYKFTLTAVIIGNKVAESVEIRMDNMAIKECQGN